MMPPANSPTRGAATTPLQAAERRNLPARMPIAPWERRAWMRETKRDCVSSLLSAGTLLSRSLRRSSSSWSWWRAMALSSAARRSRSTRACSFRLSRPEKTAKRPIPSTTKAASITNNMTISLDFHDRIEERRGEAEAISREALGNLGTNAGGTEAAAYLAFRRHPSALEDENFLHGEGFGLHAGDLGAAGGAARAVG